MKTKIKRFYADNKDVILPIAAVGTGLAIFALGARHGQSLEKVIGVVDLPPLKEGKMTIGVVHKSGKILSFTEPDRT